MQQVVNIPNDLSIEEDIDFYDVMPDTIITMRGSRFLHEILIIKLSHNTSNDQRLIDSNTLKTMLHNDISTEENIADLFTTMLDAMINTRTCSPVEEIYKRSYNTCARE